MVTAYFDTSALVKLLIAEDGTELAVRLWDGADAVVTHPSADLELATVFAAAVRTERISPSEGAASLDAWESYRRGVRWAHPGPDVTWFRGMASRHVLRGNDLVHLQSALMLQRAWLSRPKFPVADRNPAVVMVVWDLQLARAAQAEGLTVVPRVAEHSG